MRQGNCRPTVITRAASSDGKWLKARRLRLHLAQSEVAAFLTVRLRKPVGQRRISDYELGSQPMLPETRAALDSFLERVEKGKKEGLAWQDLLASE